MKIEINVANWYREFKRDMFWICLIFVALQLCGGLVTPVDSSDRGLFERSGMRPHIDAMTGCQYFSAEGGGITPRLGRDGKQICGSPL